MIELRHLHTLIALRDTGTLTGAAEQLHLSQSALSHQLKDLEERLGLGLFERKSRPLRFSLPGERLLALADTVLAEVRAAEQQLAHLRDGRSGRLHIAVECHSCFDWLMPALDSYRGYWPQVELDLSMGYGFEPLSALVRREVDLVVTADPAEGVEISYLPLFRFQNVLLLSTHHQLAARDWIEPPDLAGEVLITYPVDTGRLDLFRRFLDPAGVVVARRTSELTVMILQLVASGRGLAVLPQWAASQAIAAGLVIARPLGRCGLWSVLHAAVRREDRQRAYLEAFIDNARQTCFGALEGLQPAD